MIVPSALLLGSLLPLVSALWPLPSSFTNGSSVVYLDPNVRLNYNGGSHQRRHPGDEFVARSADGSSDAQLITDAFARFKDTVKKASYVPWKFYLPGTNFEPQGGGYGGATIRTVTIEKSSTSSNTTAGEIDESYELEVTKDGQATIKASTANGAMYGLTTLSQLFYASQRGGMAYTNQAPISIQDTPAFSWRGANIDIARNFQPPATIKRVIDGLAFNKINRLHVHATDSQSWPLEIPSMPELSAKGAYKADDVWSANDLKDLEAYAKARGIQTVIEIDSPGHSGVIGLSHPDLVVGYNEKPWDQYCAEPPCGQVKLNDPDVDTFFAKLLDDLLPRMKPYTSYYHSGGDEFNANIYNLDPTVHSNSSDVIKPYLERFVNNVHKVVRAHGFTPLVWEEMVLDWNLTLPTNDTIVQTWLGPSSVDKLTAKGYKALIGDYNNWYLDCGWGQWLDPKPGNAQTPIKPPYTDWCGPMKSWREVYSYDPITNLTDAQKKLVPGGVVHLWGELTDQTNLDPKLWPRASAAAEILWSGVKGVQGVNEAVTRRLADVRERMVSMGFEASMVQMTWCLQHPGDCSL